MQLAGHSDIIGGFGTGFDVLGGTEVEFSLGRGVSVDGTVVVCFGNSVVVTLSSTIICSEVEDIGSFVSHDDGFSELVVEGGVDGVVELSVVEFDSIVSPDGVDGSIVVVLSSVAASDGAAVVLVIFSGVAIVVSPDGVVLASIEVPPLLEVSIDGFVVTVVDSSLVPAVVVGLSGVAQS